MTDVIISDATSAVVSQANRKARRAVKAKSADITAKTVAGKTLAWIKADAAALVSQGAAVSAMMRACKGMGKTHEEKNGQWKPTKAFQMFRTEYLSLLQAKHGESGVDKGQIIIRFAFRALRVNMTPDAMAETVGKVQTVLEAKEEEWAKSGRTKTDHSLGGEPGKGGRPGGGEGTGDVVANAVKYLDSKLTPTEAINAIMLWAKSAKKVQALTEALEKAK